VVFGSAEQEHLTRTTKFLHDMFKGRGSSMLKHIVLLKLKTNAQGASKEENARKIKQDLESLKDKIPQIRHLEVGINSIRSEASYDVSIYSEFANEMDLTAYARHPEHLKVADFVGKVRESRAVVDYIV
jgi:hypothetical protein